MTLLRPQTGAIPVPAPSPESAPYWEGCAAGELRFQRCRRCDTPNFGPGLGCRSCQGTDLAWEVSSGWGRVVSWTVVWRPPSPAFRVPYAPAIVELEEGFVMLAAVIGCEHDAVRSDMAVAVEFHPARDSGPAGPDAVLPYFTLPRRTGRTSGGSPR